MAAHSDEGKLAHRPGWPPLFALFTTPWRPATTAQRTQHVSLLRAWAIHVISALLTLGAIVLMVALDELPTWSWIELRHAIRELSDQVVVGMTLHPEATLSASAGAILGVEAFTLLLALMVLPWGARVEKLRSSVAHALRRSWLATPHVIWLVLILGGCVILPLDSLQARYTRSHRFPAYPVLSNTATQTAEDWNEQHQAYSLAVRAYESQKPLVLRYQSELIWVATVAGILWFLWALLRSAAAPRMDDQISIPPSCEFCGYNLIATQLDALCPECGRPAIESLGEQARTGVPWERRSKVGCLRAYVLTLFQGIFRPGNIGQVVRLYAPGDGYRLFLVVNSILIALISWVSFSSGLLIFGESIGLRELEAGASIATTIGFISFAVMLLSAASIGVVQSLREKRNLLPASVQAAAYLGGLALLNICLAWIAGLYALSEPPLIVALSQQFKMSWRALAFFVWFCFFLSEFAFWLLWNWRAALPARYANR